MSAHPAQSVQRHTKAYKISLHMYFGKKKIKKIEEKELKTKTTVSLNEKRLSC